MAIANPAFGSASFSIYNANHQRWKQVANYAGVTETTRYIGVILEKYVKSGVTEYRHQILIGSGTEIYTRHDNSTKNTIRD